MDFHLRIQRLEEGYEHLILVEYMVNFTFYHTLLHIRQGPLQICTREPWAGQMPLSSPNQQWQSSEQLNGEERIAQNIKHIMACHVPCFEEGLVALCVTSLKCALSLDLPAATVIFISVRSSTSRVHLLLRLPLHLLPAVALIIMSFSSVSPSDLSTRSKCFNFLL